MKSLAATVQLNGRNYGTGSMRLALKRSMEQAEIERKEKKIFAEAEAAAAAAAACNSERKKKRRRRSRSNPPASAVPVAVALPRAPTPSANSPQKSDALPKLKVKVKKTEQQKKQQQKRQAKRRAVGVFDDKKPEREVKAGSAGACLCLGMVYAKTDNTGSQAMRDRPRLVALERSLGYSVHTLDLTHDPDIAVRGRNGTSSHCNANWNSTNRFFRSVWEAWPGVQYSCVIMDYVRTPTGWTSTHITRSFYRETLPLMSKRILAPEGRIFLPNLPGIYEQIKKTTNIRKYYYIRLVKPQENPLFVATGNAREALRNVTGYTNEGEVGKLCYAADTSRKLPFIMLTIRDESKRRYNRSRTLKQQLKQKEPATPKHHKDNKQPGSTGTGTGTGTGGVGTPVAAAAAAGTPTAVSVSVSVSTSSSTPESTTSVLSTPAPESGPPGGSTPSGCGSTASPLSASSPGCEQEVDPEQQEVDPEHMIKEADDTNWMQIQAAMITCLDESSPEEEEEEELSASSACSEDQAILSAVRAQESTKAAEQAQACSALELKKAAAAAAATRGEDEEDSELEEMPIVQAKAKL